MTKTKKTLLVVGIIGVCIGGFTLARFLTRNTKKYKYYTVIISQSDEPILSSEDVE